MLKVVLGVAFWCLMASVLFASGGSCGGGGGGAGFCGFGGSDYPFELPKVEEDVTVGGLTLKLDRTKWGYSVFSPSAGGPLARFLGEDIEVILWRMASPPESGRLLAKTVAGQAGVLYARPVWTSGAMRGVKAVYGVRRGFALRDQTAVRYFIGVSDRSWLCFEARPTGKAPQWHDASDLILGARPDRSRS
ncbi:MAG TPA: hypothetical protein VIS96_16385 [Terrimicrobiaceae bacterium]